MRRLFLGIVCLGLIAGAVAWSRGQQAVAPTAAPDLQAVVEERNPWTHLRLNNDPGEFQFVVVSDRTGGHRARVFSQAVEQINLLQPEFVVSVGDLIEGYSEDRAKVEDQWREFQSYVCKLQMPFFYVPGNHDVANAFMEKLWGEKFGRRYYHFTYRNVLFLMLNCDDPPRQDQGGISPDQIAYVRKALDENKEVRWTVVCLHRPMWSNNSDPGRNGWDEVEKALASRPYTVFCGHLHHYRKYVRQGRHYYQLATTGGSSKMRGVRYGEFDHIAWVTMKKNGPVIANVLLDGVFSADMKQAITDEAGVVTANRKPVHPVRGKVFFEGCPAVNAVVTFHLIDGKKFTRTADSMVGPDGNFSLSTYTADDGAPAGEYAVTVVCRHPALDEDGRPGPNILPAAYSKPETTPLRATIKAGPNEVVLEVKK